MLEITYKIIAIQDWTSVRGNAMASGDDALDKQVEDEIIARLDAGDVWAWASVDVIAECEGYEGHAYLGGCSYKDEDDFRENSGYYPQMCDEARDALRTALAKAAERGGRAAELLAQFDTPAEPEEPEETVRVALTALIEIPASVYEEGEIRDMKKAALEVLASWLKTPEGIERASCQGVISVRSTDCDYGD